MLMRRVPKIRVMVWGLALGVMFAIGLWAGGLTSRHDPLTEFPYVVRIAHSESGGPAHGGFEIRDRQTINFLDTLFPNYRQEAKAGTGIPPSGEHHVLEFNLERSGYSKKLFVWSEGDNEYWSSGRDRSSVQGSFRRLLEWLPIRRALEMTISSTADRSTGRKLLADDPDHILGVVIDNGRHQVGTIRVWAIRDLLNLVSHSAPHTAHRTGASPTYQRVDGLISGPLPDTTSHISEIRQLALNSLDGDSRRDAHTLLAFTANEATTDELIRRLEVESNTHTNAELIICLQGCLGLPEFHRGGMCGNSSPAEFAQFAESETKRTNEAKAALLAWLSDWKAQSFDGRQVAVLTAWETEFVRKPNDGEHLFAAQTNRFRNLLQRGSAMLPAVEKLQSETSDLTRRGALEFLKAYWTGNCDRTLVEELLKSNRHSQIIACDIIAAAGDTTWKDRLAELLRTPRSPSEVDVRAWVNMVDKAAETLAICHDTDALPLLREVDHYGFSTVRYALQHFQVPQGLWERRFF